MERQQGARTNLWSWKPAEVDHRLDGDPARDHARRYLEAEADPRSARLRFVQLQSQREADALLATAVEEKRAADKEA